MVVSIIVLAYDTYVFVKECMERKEEEDKRELIENRLSVENAENAYRKNSTLENLPVNDISEDSCANNILDSPEENLDMLNINDISNIKDITRLRTTINKGQDDTFEN